MQQAPNGCKSWRKLEIVYLHVLLLVFISLSIYLLSCLAIFIGQMP